MTRHYDLTVSEQSLEAGYRYTLHVGNAPVHQIDSERKLNIASATRLLFSAMGAGR